MRHLAYLFLTLAMFCGPGLSLALAQATDDDAPVAEDEQGPVDDEPADPADDIFLPSEEIKADSEISFPSDI